MNIPHKKLVLASILIFLLGWFTHGYFNSRKDENKSAVPIREMSNDYKYIDPLLVIDNNEEKFEELNPLKNKLEKYISDEIRKNKAKRISTYFRDLTTIQWTGVNENELYSPGSMLKVSTLISYLKLVTEDPKILQTKQYYNFKEEPGQHYQPVPLKAGDYSNLTLLQQMIVHSDNTAMEILQEKNIDQILTVYRELKMPNPVGSSRDFMSPLYYSRLFRLLYNSTYLPRRYSDQALKLLTYTSFKLGITKWLPENIEVAHKFGEQTFTEDGEIKSRELHDCGIVYYPDHPYVICIMTEGNDFKDLEDIISNISKITFEYQKSTK